MGNASRGFGLAMVTTIAGTTLMKIRGTARSTLADPSNTGAATGGASSNRGSAIMRTIAGIIPMRKGALIRLVITRRSTPVLIRGVSLKAR